MTEPNLLIHLQELAEDDPSQPPHARAFSQWILTEPSERSTVLDSIARDAIAVSGPARHPSHVAVLGFTLDIGKRNEAVFLDGVSWLKERKYFVSGRPRGFEADGLGLLGVAVGLRALLDPNRDDTWLADILRKSLADAEANNDWNGSLISAAGMVLGLPTNSRPIADLVVALHAKGVAHSTTEERNVAWRAAFDVRGSDDGMTRAATRVAAINFLSRDAPVIRFDKVEVEDVARLLHGLGRSFRHWTWEEKPRTPRSLAARWDIENEYHLQNILWALLAPIFPDLDEEEWLKSLAQHHPRGDFAIPSLRLVIEAKYMRAATSFSSIVEEVAADASTYLQDGSGFKHLIPVVWDDAARTEQHAELRRGLIALRGVTDAVIISRPSFMVRATT